MPRSYGRRSSPARSEAGPRRRHENRRHDHDADDLTDSDSGGSQRSRRSRTGHHPSNDRDAGHRMSHRRHDGHRRDKQEERDSSDVELLTQILDYLSCHTNDRVTIEDLVRQTHESSKRVRGVAGNCHILVMQGGMMGFIDGHYLPLCTDHLENGCNKLQCNNIHICPAFVLDECCDRPCTKGHGLGRHNRSIMDRLGLWMVPDQTVAGVLAAIVGPQCQREQAQATRRAAALSRNQASQPAPLQQSSGGTHRQLPTKQAPPTPARPPPPPFRDTTRSQNSQICVEHLKNKCQEPCPQGEFHGPRPFQWQVQDPVSNNWYNFHVEQNDELDLAYQQCTCDDVVLTKLHAIRGMGNFNLLRTLLQAPEGSPAKNWQADFEAMQLVDTSGQTSAPLVLRRLSTPSVAAVDDIWATGWRWYFKWTEARRGGKHRQHDEPTQESDEDEELKMEVTALEECIRILMNKGKTGVLRRDTPLEKTGIDKATLAKIISGYPGIIGGYHVNGKSGNKRERQVGLIPVFRLCPKYQRSKGCISRTCRDLHICCDYLLTRKCKSSDSKKKRSRGKGDKDEKRRSCPFGHTLDDTHNLRVLRKVLEVQDIRIFSPDTLLDLVTFCCEDYDEDESEADGSSSDSSASSESSAENRTRRKSNPKGKGHRSRDSDDSDSRDRSGSNGNIQWGTRKTTQKSSYKHGAVSNRKSRTQSPKHGLHGDQGSRSARNLENRGAVGGGSPSYDQGFMKSDAEKTARFVPIICADHAKGRCKFAGPRCGKVHGPPGKLYQWQVKEINTNGPWLSLTDGHSDQLEGEFAKPEIIKVNLQPRKSNERSSCVYPLDDANQVIKASSNWTADFDTMTVSETVSSNGNQRVLLLRRVGGYPKEGPTSGTGDTLWHWYFFDNKQRWVKYGEKAEAVYNTGRTTSSDTTSDRIEEHFITELRRTGGTDGPALPETAALKAYPLRSVQPLFFKTGYHEYLLDFTKLVQRNISVGTERPICRRPAPGPSGVMNTVSGFKLSAVWG